MTMPLNIKSPAVEALVNEIIKITGETKTEAVRRALEQRKRQLAFQVVEANRAQRLRTFLEQEVWSVVPADQLGRRLSKEEEEDLLGLGSEGA